jgi:hypothetical protein
MTRPKVQPDPDPDGIEDALTLALEDALDDLHILRELIMQTATEADDRRMTLRNAVADSYERTRSARETLQEVREAGPSMLDQLKTKSWDQLRALRDELHGDC